MNNEEIIREILKRFRLDTPSIRNLEKYELELIYQAFPKIPFYKINNAISSYKNKEFSISKFRYRIKTN